MTLADVEPVLPMARAALVMLTLGVALAFYRLVRGPSLPDRVVALDLIAVLTVGILGTFSIASEEPMNLRPAMVLALISFLGTIAFARYLQRKALP